jgi:hypothetical protein
MSNPGVLSVDMCILNIRHTHALELIIMNYTNVHIIIENDCLKLTMQYYDYYLTNVYTKLLSVCECSLYTYFS